MAGLDLAATAPRGLSALPLTRRLARRAVRFAAPAAIFLAWELLARTGTISEFMLPAPSHVLARIGEDITSGDVFLNIALTLYRTFLGFGLAAIGGVTLGLAMARSRWAHWFFDPIVSVGFPMPKIAFLPVFILWFGLYDGSKITIITVSAIFPVITATVAALRGVEKELIWSAQSLGASPRRAAWEIAIPAALPQILTGLQVALPTALIVAIISEMMMGGFGLGGAMMESSRLLDSTGVFAGIVETALTGHGVISAIALVRRRLLIWHQEGRDPTTA
jgi:ABC-type nitrate/sulfonate/bicarbonate transport system permease component